MDISLKDFQPINHWKPDFDGPRWWRTKEPQFIIDLSTNRRYLNEDSNIVRFKSFLLTIGTPFVHSIATIVNIACKTLKIATLSHFWIEKDEGLSYSLKNRIIDMGIDISRIATAPIALIGLELAAIYGVLKPYDGRKLYATIERAEYGNFILAPCFQPDPSRHAFGGDINQKNAF